MTERQPPSFDEIAVALSLAAIKVRMDLEQMEILAARVGMSPMGTQLAIAELQKTLDYVAHAHAFFKDNASIEREIRAAAQRRKIGSWWPRSLKGAAAL